MSATEAPELLPPASPVIDAPMPGPSPMSEGELAEVITAFNDVTAKLQSAHESLRREVVRLQEELRVANEQLERSRRLAALGEMAAGIAHEVRNPLGSIRLYARMLEQDLVDRPGERVVAEKIGSAVRGLDAVVVDVLAFAKEMRVHAQPVDPAELIDRAVEEGLAGDGAGRDAHAPIRVVRQITPFRVAGDGAALVCDPQLAHRALVNVVRNAAQAMREHSACRAPTLTLEAQSCCELGPDGSSRWSIAVSVRDNGPGVPADVLERMFNPFFTTRATGTGLGLAIVHRIMDAHGGRVLVRNAEIDDPAPADRRGAIVELRFPIHATRAARSMDTTQVLRGEGSPALVG